jgi:chemotaxis protein MotB
VAILHELAGFIEQAPNKVSISGHTDDAPYSGESHYGNWELSADRANAARRALLDGGLDEDKIARVVGLAASVPFDKSNPGNPINRRISIIMMTKQAQDAALSQEQAEAVPPPAPGRSPSALPSAP